MEDRGADDEGIALETRQEDVGIADAEVSLPTKDDRERGALAPALEDPHVEALGRVVALGEGSVVARKLELVMPLQLQPNGVVCEGCPRDEQ